MNPHLPPIKQVIMSAKRRRLYVLLFGSGHSLKYDFFDRRTGRIVLTYYPKSKRWLGTGDSRGLADDYEAALEAGLGPIPARNPR